MLTPDERNRLHEAMLAAQGDVDRAAGALQCEPAALKQRLREDPNLKARWLEPVKVPTPIDTLNREPAKVSLDLDDIIDLPPAPSAKDAALAAAVGQQDDKLRRLDWEGLGVKDPRALDLMRSFEQFAGGQIMQTIDATHGGMLHDFANISSRLEWVNEQIQLIEQQCGKGQPTDKQLMQLTFLYQIHEKLSGLKIKINDTATRAAYTRLQIIDRARKLQGASNKLKRKAGWRRVPPAAAKGNNGPKQ